MKIGYKMRVIMAALLVAVGVLLPLPVHAAMREVVSVDEYGLPSDTEGTLLYPRFIEAGADGNLWFSEYSGTKIARITPSGVVTEYSVGSGLAVGTFGPDGNYWATLPAANQIVRVNPTTGVVDGFTFAAGLNPFGVNVGPDGNLWVGSTNTVNSRIARVTPAGVITEFALPTTTATTSRLTSGPDGNLWFTEQPVSGNNRIARVTPAGVITEFALSATGVATTNAAPVVGSDGNLWGIEAGAASAIYRVTPAGVVTEFPLPSSNALVGSYSHIVVSSDKVCFTESTVDKIGCMAMDGTLTEYALAASTFPTGIVIDSDDVIWFLGAGTDKIGRLAPDGTITETSFPTSGTGAPDLAIGPDGNLWFTESGVDQIGVARLAYPVEPPVPPESVTPGAPATGVAPAVSSAWTLLGVGVILGGSLLGVVVLVYRRYGYKPF